MSDAPVPEPTAADPLVAWLAARDALAVAPALLGGTITTTTDAGSVTVRITETEAYLGERDSAAPDPGAHSFRGRTRRNAVLFGPAGHLYVYFTYGMHHCANVVCGQDGTATGVLLRAGEVIDGHDLARRRRDGARGRTASRPAPDRDLARGPARLARTLGLHLRDNGVPIAPGVQDSRTVSNEADEADDAADPVHAVRVHRAEPPAADDAVSAGPRVGVSGPGGSADYPWRFWLTGDPTVSPYRPAVTRRRR